jgi:hypothetical protein
MALKISRRSGERVGKCGLGIRDPVEVFRRKRLLREKTALSLQNIPDLLGVFRGGGSYLENRLLRQIISLPLRPFFSRRSPDQEEAGTEGDNPREQLLMPPPSPPRPSRRGKGASE